jgi:hypothetical protein
MAVTNAGIRPKVSFSGNWLSDMGFETDALVMATPQPGGLTFTLCDEQITRYSDLVRQTREKNGKLLQVIHVTYKGIRYPAVATYGAYLLSGGLSIGDTVIARYAPGIIRMKQLDQNAYGENAQFATVGSIKEKRSACHMAKVRLTGPCLSAAGFEKDTLVLARPEQGKLTLTLQDEGIKRYSDLVKFARKHKLKLLQVAAVSNRGKPVPHIGLTGSVLSAAGLEMDDLFVITARPESLTLEKIAFTALGF